MASPPTALGQLKPFALPLAVLPLAALGLGFSPSPALVLALLVVLLHQARRDDDAAPSSRPGAPTLAAAAIALVPGWTLAYYKDIRSALQSSSQPVVGLALLSALLAAVAVGIVGASEWLAAWPLLRSTPVARLLLFPVLWTSRWAVLGLLSPLGWQVRVSWAVPSCRSSERGLTPPTHSPPRRTGRLDAARRLLLRLEHAPATHDWTVCHQPLARPHGQSRLCVPDEVRRHASRRGALRRRCLAAALLVVARPPRPRLGRRRPSRSIACAAAARGEPTVDERSPLLPVINGGGDPRQPAPAPHATNDHSSSDDGGESTIRGGKASSRQASSHFSLAASAHNPHATSLSSRALFIAGASSSPSSPCSRRSTPTPRPPTSPSTRTRRSASRASSLRPLARKTARRRSIATSTSRAGSSRPPRSCFGQRAPSRSARAQSGTGWSPRWVRSPRAEEGGSRSGRLRRTGSVPRARRTRSSWLALAARSSTSTTSSGACPVSLRPGPVVPHVWAAPALTPRPAPLRPVAESFSIAKHPQLPPTFTLALPVPHHVAKSSWSTPELDYKRPVHLTSIICNGTPFRNLFLRMGRD